MFNYKNLMNKFDPPIWIGNQYENGGIFEKRIIIIGESTYWSGQQPNISMATDHFADKPHSDKYRTKLVRMFLNKDNETREEIAEFWHSVSFFNYFKTVLSGPYRSPTQEMLKQHQPLPDILDALKPNLILIVMLRMWDYFVSNPPCKIKMGPIIKGARRSQTYHFESKSGLHSALGYAVKHPTYASWSLEHVYTKEAIKLA